MKSLQRQPLSRAARAAIITCLASVAHALRDTPERDTVTLGVNTGGKAWKFTDADDPHTDADDPHTGNSRRSAAADVTLSTSLVDASDHLLDASNSTRTLSKPRLERSTSQPLPNRSQEPNSTDNRSYEPDPNTSNEINTDKKTKQNDEEPADLYKIQVQSVNLADLKGAVENLIHPSEEVMEAIERFNDGCKTCGDNKVSLDLLKERFENAIKWAVHPDNPGDTAHVTLCGSKLSGFPAPDNDDWQDVIANMRSLVKALGISEDRTVKPVKLKKLFQKDREEEEEEYEAVEALPEHRPFSRYVQWNPSWVYNPFRKYFGQQGSLESDLQCPSMDQYYKARHNLTLGEIVMCQLRYTTLYVCNLPNNTCILCSCEQAEEEHPCVDRTCYMKLPFIWMQWYVCLPAIIAVVHLAFAPVLGQFYARLMQFKTVQQTVVLHIGTAEAAPEKIEIRVYLLVIQIVASAVNVFLYCVANIFESQSFPWVNSTVYTPQWNAWLQVVMNFQMLVNFYVSWCKNEFSGFSILSTNALIDIATVHATLVKQFAYTVPNPPISRGFNADMEKTWLALSRPQMTWQFLRSYRCLSALMEMQSMGGLSQFTPVQTQLMKSSLRLWALVNLFTGATMIAEWIGHDTHMSSNIEGTKYLGDCATKNDLATNNIACIPFAVGIYWVFTTISSVGYGDFGPVSAPTYLLVIFFIVAGVTFFSVETQTLLDVVEEQGTGVRAANVRGVHVVVTGGAMRDVDTSVLQPFIAQLFHRAILEQNGDWPELVILGQVKDHNDVLGFISNSLSGDMARNIHFCNADPLTPAALRQAKVDSAKIVYILPSSLNDDVDTEDEYNTQVALSVKSLSKTPLRLVLFRMRSIGLATAGGVHPGQCCSINDLRTSLMAQSTRVRGWAHVLTLMTNNVTTNMEGARGFCHDAMFPKQYFPSLSHTVRGFALSKYSAGVTFTEVAFAMYVQTGALAICMLKTTAQGDRIRCFPWSEVAIPNSIIFCLHPIEFVKDPRATQFVAPIDWEQQLLKVRQKSERTLGGKLERASTIKENLDDDFPSGAADEQDMLMMKGKARVIRERAEPFVLVVMTELEDMWTMLNMYVQKFVVQADTAFGGRFGVIVLADSKPPKAIAATLQALDPDAPVAFVQGDWTKPDDLREAGAEQCKVLFVFPVTSALSAEPTQDSRIIFFIQIVKNLSMRKETLVLFELGSGMVGAHVIPTHEDTPLPPPRVSQEIAYNPPCASGQVFVPRMIMGLLAKTFYTFGVLEVFQALATDNPDPNAARPEQICVPKELILRPFNYAVEALLQKRIGPCPALLLGILRETLDAEVVLLKPEKSTSIQASDLLFLLCDGHWAKWADEQGLRCMGGRNRRSVDVIDDKVKRQSETGDADPELPTDSRGTYPTQQVDEEEEEEEEEQGRKGGATDYFQRKGFIDPDPEG